MIPKYYGGFDVSEYDLPDEEYDVKHWKLCKCIRTEVRYTEKRDPIIFLLSKYSHSYETSEWVPYNNNNTGGYYRTKTKYNYENFTTNLVYPYDFYCLLDRLEQYLSKKTAPKKALFHKKEKQPHLSKSTKILLEFYQTNRKSIEQFRQYVNSTDVEQKEYRRFCQKQDHYILEVDNEVFFEGYCGFDIHEELEKIQILTSKLKASYDPGEAEVEHEMKWILADSKIHFTEIKKNCESKYRYGCILLKNPEFIDEPQEYDHILVCDAGVILIETKHWKGRVEIRPDGKWIRDPENNGKIIGEKNPVAQIKRHEMLMKSIVPNVPVYSLLCFSNSSLILDGVENFKDYPVTYVDQLKNIIMQLANLNKASNGVADYIVKEIEKHKINIVEDICEL